MGLVKNIFKALAGARDKAYTNQVNQLAKELIKNGAQFKDDGKGGVTISPKPEKRR